MKKWIFIILGILAISGALTGVIYGVLSHKEAGLLTVCWKEGKANYDGDCKELKWLKSQLPLRYYIDFSEEHKYYIESVVKGADLWNQEVGITLFLRVDKEEEAVIQVEWGSQEPGKCAGGSTSHTGMVGPTKAKVVLTEPSDMHAVYRYAAHEWGHVLGLAHDESARSIMYPVQPGITEEIVFVLPSDHDRELLRTLYK